MQDKNYTILIKKFNGHFVALCLELNVSAQGENLIEVKNEMAKAIEEYTAFNRETNITSALLDLDTMKEFLLEQDRMQVAKDIYFSENFSMNIPYENTSHIKQAV